MELTVLMLSCRRIALLEQTLRVARRHFQDVEPHVATRWVCFDNGSEPEDQARLARLGFDLLLLSRENLGQAPAWNQVLASVRTEYFMFLEDDWLLENPDDLQWARSAALILERDRAIGSVKLDALHFMNFADRVRYAGPFAAEGEPISYYVQNPGAQWGGFTFPPALTRTSCLQEVGRISEDHNHRRWYTESEYSARFAQHYHTAKSPELALFHHIGDVPSPGWDRLLKDSMEGSSIASPSNA